MEWIVLLLAVLFLLWKIKDANDEAFSSNVHPGTSNLSEQWENTSSAHTSSLDSHSPLGDEDRRLWDSHSFLDNDTTRRWDSHDDCDISRAMWDPSCPMYHVFNDHWNSSNDSWWSSSNDWDSGSSSWDSWGSSSWDS